MFLLISFFLLLDSNDLSGFDVLFYLFTFSVAVYNFLPLFVAGFVLFTPF